MFFIGIFLFFALVIILIIIITNDIIKYHDELTEEFNYADDRKSD